MKNTIKSGLSRIISLILAASMLLSIFALTGCADNSKDSSQGESSNSQLDADAVDSDDDPAPKKPEITVVRNESTIDFSEGSGIFGEEFSLSITSDLSEIYYTTDGSDPAISDTAILYDAPIQITDRSGDKNVIAAVDPVLFSGNFNMPNLQKTDYTCIISPPKEEDVDKCTVIRAAAKGNDGSFTQTSTQTYFIGTMEEHIEGIKESCEAAGYDLAVISMSIDFEDLFNSSYGIYCKGDIWQNDMKLASMLGGEFDNEAARSFDANYKQKGREWEREVHIDFFECNENDAELVLSQNCGVRIQGNYSRSDLQKGFRLFARADYGDNNFRYAVFGEDYVNDSGEVMDKFKTLVLRAGGNTAFTAKFNDTYWQSLASELNVETKKSRPCILYINGEYFGLYVLEEDYTDDFFEDVHGVLKEDVVVYKGDAESLSLGYKLDEGTLPEGEKKESYYFNELLSFISSHDNLRSQKDYDEFVKLVDPNSVMDYFALQVWINNKWDWPGKNWSMWKTTTVDSSNEYNDGRWRFMVYDVEFGGVSGLFDAYTNTIKEDNYKELGLLDMNTDNPAVLCFALLMTNENFRNDYCDRLLYLSANTLSPERTAERLNEFKNTYSPLYSQFFRRYTGAGTIADALEGVYASVKCIEDFISERHNNIQPMIDWVNQIYQ